MLVDNDTIPVVASILSPADFYRDSHQILFRSIVELAEAGSRADVLIVEEYLRQRGKLEKVGGIDLLLEVTASIPHTANAKHYAQIVKQRSVNRSVIGLAQQVVDQAYNDATAEEVLAKLRDGLGTVENAFARGEADDLDTAPIEIATLADIRSRTTETSWLWPGWIIGNHMTAIAAEPATGKTRLSMDLCRRMYNCLPWPDGQMATRPMGTCSLWIASDRTHSEMVRVAADFGLPDDAVYFNSAPSDPFGGIKLDDPREIKMFRRRVRYLGSRLGAIFIDTINKATRRALYRPEEAEAFFGPLIDVAVDLQVPLVAITHLSRSGESLDRRIEGTCRVLVKLAKPDGEETTTRRRLWVSAIRDGVPAAPVGVTMGTNGNEYDGDAPQPTTSAKAGAKRVPPAVEKAMEWLREYLEGGPAFCGATIQAALEAGHNKRIVFRAIKELRIVKEGGYGKHYYRLPRPEEADAPSDEAEGTQEAEDDEMPE